MVGGGEIGFAGEVGLGVGVTTATCFKAPLPLTTKKAITATLAARSDPTVMRMPAEPLDLFDRRVTGRRTDTNDVESGRSGAAATSTGSAEGICNAVVRRASLASIIRACRAS